MSWHQDAACRGVTHLFYAEHGQGLDAARKLCAGCPVASQCLQDGLYEDHGLWGGLTVKERRRLRVRRPFVQPIRHGTEGGDRAHRRRGETPCPECRRAAALANRLRAQARRVA